jgi:hypothetical protein
MAETALERRLSVRLVRWSARTVPPCAFHILSTRLYVTRQTNVAAETVEKAGWGFACDFPQQKTSLFARAFVFYS